jgi:PAS domain S-box-containing protein
VDVDISYAADFYEQMDPVQLRDLLLSVFDKSSDAIFLKDKEGKYVLFNRAAGRFVGKNPEEVLGRDDRAVFESESAEMIIETDLRVMRTGLPELEEEVRLSAGGVTRFYRASKAPLRDSKGEIVGVVGIARDITDQRATEKDLAVSQNQLATTERIAQVGCWEIDFLNEEMHLSAESCGLYGLVEKSGPYDLAEVLAVIHPEDRALEEEVRRAALRGECSYSVEFRVIKLSGEVRFLRCGGEVKFDESGRPLRAFGVVQDISQSRQSEMALRRSEQILRLVVEALPVAVQVMDLNGDILLSNPAGEKIWGKIIGAGQERYSAVKGSWHDTGELISPRDWASQRALRTGEVSQDEVIDIEAFDGEQRTILNSAIPIRDSDQDIIGAVILNEDITEQLSLEQQVRQSQKMEAVGQLAGGVAHDFNNLLTVVSGYGELLREGMERTNPDRELVEEILKAADRATSLTRQLLAFSRQTVLQPTVVNLNDVVADSENMLRRLIREDIKLTVNLDPHAGSVRVDPAQLNQVLLNLSVNARDAMPDGGRLTIETLRLDGRDEFAAILVSDSGEGMSKAVQERIFEPFFTTKPKDQGTGLGLATVYGIIKQSGGEVKVKSEPGLGSQFTILIPVADGDGLAKSCSSPQPAQTRGSERILLVEDQESVRFMIARALVKSGYKVTQATQGVHALEVWEKEGPFDLVVTDVVMPEMGGGRLVEELKRRVPEVRVLYISGYIKDALVHQGIKQAKVSFLQKPFALKDLKLKVREILDCG